jgi:hypothetical protein
MNARRAVDSDVTGYAAFDLYEASNYLGVPSAQLLRWAAQGVGPEFSGHPLRPKHIQYTRRSLDLWRQTKGFPS